MANDSDIIATSVSEFYARIEELQAEGYRLDMISPADAPRIAELSRGGERIRLTAEGSLEPGSESEGRAGMLYRDLVPDRLDGRLIASHITLLEPGPVPDYVHHHDVDFQIIFVRSGRVKVVYEDQGEPFWMEPGDCVLQPPGIRHRVLETDGRLEVIEVTSPAEHPTYIEHEHTLPTTEHNPDRIFDGQRFFFDRRADAVAEVHDDGWSIRETGIATASNGAGGIRVLTAIGTTGPHQGSAGPGHRVLVCLAGEVTVETQDVSQRLEAGGAISLEPEIEWVLSEPAPNSEALDVILNLGQAPP